MKKYQSKIKPSKMEAKKIFCFFFEKRNLYCYRKSVFAIRLIYTSASFFRLNGKLSRARSFESNKNTACVDFKDIFPMRA
jgi:hypothetical protein